MMRIVLLECKKAFTSPILLALLLLFTVFNIFTIYSQSYIKEELKVTNELAKTYGTHITEHSLAQLELDLQNDLAELNNLTKEKLQKTYASTVDFFETVSYDEQSLFTHEEWERFTQLYLKELSYMTAKNIDEEYERIDLMKVAESEARMYGLSGKAADKLYKQYEQFAERFEEMKELEKHKEWFFDGSYKMHSFLFRSTFRQIIFESLIMIVLATALITNFEFEKRTHLVTYTTARGRSLMKDKLGSSLIVSSVITLFLFITTLSTYFLVFDYSYLWGSSISSAFNWEYNLPYVSWWDLSFLTFLLSAVILVFACMLLFSGITFALSILLKNNYFTFIVFAILFAVALLIPGFMPQSSRLIIFTHFNLSSLVMNPHYFFMGLGGLTNFQYYELITIFISTVITVSLCILAFKLFKKQEIH